MTVKTLTSILVMSVFSSLAWAQGAGPAVPPPAQIQAPTSQFPTGQPPATQLPAMPLLPAQPTKMMKPPPAQPLSQSPFGSAPSAPMGFPAMPNTTVPNTGSLLESGAAARGLPPRDPFRLPEILIIKIRQKNAPAATGNGIDMSVDVIRRYPLISYQLVGIIWDVKKPKAMFMDHLNNIHVMQINDFIGNAKGVITSIQSGSVTVLEGRIPQIIKLKK